MRDHITGELDERRSRASACACSPAQHGRAKSRCTSHESQITSFLIDICD